MLSVIMLYISRGLCGIIHDSLQDLVENGAQSWVLYEVTKRIKNRGTVHKINTNQVEGNIAAVGGVSLATTAMELCSMRKLRSIRVQSQAINLR